MILSKMQCSPDKRLPIAMTLLASGLFILLLGVAWPRFVPPSLHLGAKGDDFLHGFCFGLGLTLELGGVFLATSAAAKKRKSL